MKFNEGFGAPEYGPAPDANFVDAMAVAGILSGIEGVKYGGSGKDKKSKDPKKKK